MLFVWAPTCDSDGDAGPDGTGRKWRTLDTGPVNLLGCSGSWSHLKRRQARNKHYDIFKLLFYSTDDHYIVYKSTCITVLLMWMDPEIIRRQILLVFLRSVNIQHRG